MSSPNKDTRTMLSVPAAGVMCPPSSSSAELSATDGGNRAYLQAMSPNVAHKRAPSSKESSKASPKRRTFSRPALPPLQSVSGPSRSHSTLGIRATSPRKMLRRSNSSMSQGTGESSDRFIPSRHTTSGKITTTDTMPHPNASPQTHIRAQSSKIYQQHIAEACGLEVNARILQFQPLPPERKKPADLFAGISTNKTRTHLAPGAASARAKNIPSAPERVLDAPGLVDDFYLNLLAWSSTNLLAIGLEDAVYVWNASTGSVGLLCESRAMVTSLRWAQDGSYVSVGRDNGMVEIWDISSNQKLRTIDNGHATRVAAQAWNAHILTAGSRTGSMYHSDVRMARHAVSTLATHTAEVCGIEYRGDGGQFSSGGNDNTVCIWDARKTYSAGQTTPVFTKSNHRAAVKALSWCPYQQSLLATGGGSSDKTIHFWNTSTGARINTIETESQISSLNWGYAAGTGMEIVATHGFPTNNISLFNYPTLQKTGEIVSAHDTRILSGCISPDYSTLATVSGDENLKFWSLFDANKKRDAVPHDETTDTKRMKKLMNIR